jgi:uncharacterized protein (TIGR00369 family)
VSERRPRVGWGDEAPPAPHIWRTLGYRGVEQRDGRSIIEWDASADYCFHSPSGPIVHGGMVATLLDTAMGGACWTLLEEDEDFLTADLRVEFLRAARPGTLRAEGTVIQRSRRVAFCSAELFDPEGTLLAAARCTQILRRPS